MSKTRAILLGAFISFVSCAFGGSPTDALNRFREYAKAGNHDAALQLIAIPPDADAETKGRMVARAEREIALFTKGWDMIPLAEHQIEGCAVIAIDEIKPGKPNANVNMDDPVYLVLVDSEWKLCAAFTKWDAYQNMRPDSRQIFLKLQEWYNNARQQSKDARPPQGTSSQPSA
jgi:hypothetical protein